MSLIITAYVREGIVMAADSRLTLNKHEPHKENQPHIHLAFGMSDSSRKLFVTPNRVGISTCGDADIQGVPIAGFIDSFINELSLDHTPQHTAEDILTHFRDIAPIPNTLFHVAGYNEQLSQEIWLVDVANNTKVEVSQSQQGVAWNGETDVITRLLKPVALQDSNGNWQPMQFYEIPYQFFTIQDAIDCVVYLIKATINTMRFQTRAKTVGGPIDVLVIYPKQSIWVKQKELHI